MTVFCHSVHWRPPLGCDLVRRLLVFHPRTVCFLCCRFFLGPPSCFRLSLVDLLWLSGKPETQLPMQNIPILLVSQPVKTDKVAFGGAKWECPTFLACL